MNTYYIIQEMGYAYKIEDGYLLCTILFAVQNKTDIHFDADDWSEIAWGCIDEDIERELLTRFIPLGLDIKTVGSCPTKD